MAHILLGWELGGNRGHATRLSALAKSLVDDGHRVTIAAQQPRQFAQVDAVTVLQSPIWSGQLGAIAQHDSLPPTSFGDVLLTLGLGFPGVFASVIRAWDSLLAFVAPDVVVSDFAPALNCATRDRIRTIGYGDGFSLPPSGLLEFPDLLRLSKPRARRPLLEMINRELRASDRDAVPYSSDIFYVDTAVVMTFAELDPYAAHRTGDYSLPYLEAVGSPGALGDEIFVYYDRADGVARPVFEALAGMGRPVRAFLAQAAEDQHATLTAKGIIVEQRPLDWTMIARRSCMVVSHGGLSFTSGALAMGLPHVIVPHDLEKTVTGLRLRKLGAGDCVASAEGVAALSDRFGQVANDTQMASAASIAANAFRERVDQSRNRDGAQIVLDLLSNVPTPVTPTSKDTGTLELIR